MKKRKVKAKKDKSNAKRQVRIKDLGPKKAPKGGAERVG